MVKKNFNHFQGHNVIKLATLTPILSYLNLPFDLSQVKLQTHGITLHVQCRQAMLQAMSPDAICCTQFQCYRNFHGRHDKALCFLFLIFFCLNFALMVFSMRSFWFIVLKIEIITWTTHTLGNQVYIYSLRFRHKSILFIVT